ncbi:hypothetical protein [Sporomusa termitida]|uniref:Uncharacterized protein n=1 Tax=Sporomusa termitida TaxID=2377 RepID=A0A517DNM5_9FIRM|nr:hypothetical protein [Sporomusa termitida]QDR78908.1 hypothetical protein SPTER_01580 [Sporomusa termitida]
MNELAAFDITRLAMDDDYYFIAHTLDCVLLGRPGESDHRRLLAAIQNGTLLEAHFFNAAGEIFVTRSQDRLVQYEPLLHDRNGFAAGEVIAREYELEEKFRQQSGYHSLTVKEYIKYDEDHLAYVEKTVLFTLNKAGDAHGGK